jgi:hypothetical protein
MNLMVLTPVIAFWKFGSPPRLQFPKWELTWGCESSFPTLSCTPGSMKCDSRASYLVRTFVSPCLSCEPKVNVTTTREVFVTNVVDAILANYGEFMWWHAHDAEVASTQYKKANGIPSPLSSDTNNP